ncbi:MAG: hypothetical protein ACLUN5_02330 [Oscillospiraceae bacterium]
MPPMISVMDCAMNTAPMTSSMNVMGTATTTSLPLMISSVESVSGALPRFSLRSSMTPLDCVDLCWPELAETLRSSMLPTCVATSPESTCGSMEPLSLAGRRPTRRPSICWVRMSVSPFASTTQTVASHWEVLRPMSGTRYVEESSAAQRSFQYNRR